jgi:RHS repeat-associated protein
VYASGSNQLSQLRGDGNGGTQLTRDYTYDENGSVAKNFNYPLSYLDHLYYYNSVGEMTGYSVHPDLQGGPPWQNWVGGTNWCHYDAAGRRIMACESGGWLGYDGDNVIRSRGQTLLLWRFAHGPSLDDPLVAVYQWTSGSYDKYYYLTDGGGRLLAFTNAQGDTTSTSVTNYNQNGGAQAGAIQSSHGFENSRAETPDSPQLSFYRNRYYDQQTGRWTQEDPAGPAGGVNLYGFVGNNPVTFSDPFGLRRCPTDVGGDGNTESVDDCPQDVQDSWAATHITNTSSDKTDIAGVDKRLYGAVVRASMAMRATLGISAGKEARHSVEGRHGVGGAVDINKVNGTRFSDMSDEDAASIGNQLGAEITNRMPYGSQKMVYTPGFAFRTNREMTEPEYRALLIQHRTHVHATIYPEQ